MTELVMIEEMEDTIEALLNLLKSLDSFPATRTQSESQAWSYNDLTPFLVKTGPGVDSRHYIQTDRPPPHPTFLKF